MIAWMGDVVIGAMRRVVAGENIMESAKNWQKSNIYISEHSQTIEDLDYIEDVRDIL